ncbi:MAG: cysteine-rich CWC family protein [Bacteroidia bacterium]|jgi:Secretion system C-terminal sorting domain/Cysteine-rich CWC|nr:cysteine-rich CWC family protein [Sphingobacteriaceae bacterium]MBK7309416.1 cysteine-rich CWC family protein [Sphingobacteriaceae bacterium]MBP9070067.1 cysteine-rich CWC family protein [Bacteroidia bacterium]
MKKKEQLTYCPNCNLPFTCKTDDIKNCFCSSITIPDKIKNHMKTKFNSCLCNTCISELISNPSKIIALTILFITLSSQCFAQFHGAPSSSNTSAMHKDSIAFVAWAKTCTVTRGWQDASDTSLGTATVGVDANGTLKAGDNPIVSLGDGGIAILTFSNSIRNGTGNDFAIFENGFADNFLELAFVEVSSDGTNFFRFLATSNTQFTMQVGAFDPLDCTKLNNFAGKYRVNYGTPFDLEELKNTSGLNVNAITHVKLIDVVGSITSSLATYDMNNNPVNDPFPTAFGSGGFDLDAVGVINENPAGLVENLELNTFHIYPNPASDELYIRSQDPNNFISYKIIDSQGRTLRNGGFQEIIDTNDLPTGLYLLQVHTHSGIGIKKIMVRH